MISKRLSSWPLARLAPFRTLVAVSALLFGAGGCARERTMDVSMVTGRLVPSATCVTATLKETFAGDELRTRERDWVIVPKATQSITAINGAPVYFVVDLVDAGLGIAARVHTDWKQQTTYTDAQRALITGYPERALKAISAKCLDGKGAPFVCNSEKADGLCPK